MINLMAMGSVFGNKEEFTKDNGSMIKKKEKDKNCSLVENHILV